MAAIVASTGNPVPITTVGFAPPCCANPDPTSAGFVILTRPVPAATTVTISASYNGTTQSLPLTVLPQDPPPTLAGVAADQASLVGGSFLNVTTTLSGLSQNNGSVALSSSNPAVLPLPATASFGFGAQSIKTLVQTQPVTTATAVTITASLNGTSASTVVNVLPGVTLSPASVNGGTASQGTVALTSPLCCNNVVVSLSSSNPAVASVPASVTIPAGSTSATFPVTTSAVTASTNVTITGNYSLPTTLPSQTAILTVLPGAAAATDTVNVTLAEYDLVKQVLNVQATSTSATATLTAFVTSSGQQIGTLTNAGGGKYQGQFSLAVNPQNLTVKSSLAARGAWQ